MSIARRTRSGTLDGPGICRKCLPYGRSQDHFALNLNSKRCYTTTVVANIVFKGMLVRNPKGGRVIRTDTGCAAAVGHGACPP